MIGERLGSYEVLAKLGEGGMGEVYRAHDPRLGRDVAIKVIRASLGADADRVQRFEREARAAAALSHPNILAVYDVGTHEAAPYIVSELLQGATLREWIDGAVLPVRKAIDISLQIARGLAAAHQKGIVHRDLKPENVFVTDDGTVKVLDFGLAKLTEVDPRRIDSASTRQADTQPGTVLGTTGYMSPEQLRGQPVDARSDIFSFGAVMYELLAGARAFRGESSMDVVTAILKEPPPDLPAAERNISVALVRIVDRCLEKNPAARFQSAGDMAFALEALSASSGTTEARAIVGAPRRHVPWLPAAAVALVVGAVAMYGAVALLRPAPAPADPVTFPLTLPEGVALVAGGPAGASPAPLAISPDGRHVAFLGSGADNVHRIWIRSRSAVAPRLLPGTEGALSPFWSPDSRQIAFFVRGTPGRLKRVDIAGGPVHDICDTSVILGGSWNADGVIIFGVNFLGIGIQRVPATGGTPTAATTVADGESVHARPMFLPDGKRFLFRVTQPLTPRAPLFLASLDSPDRVRLVETESTNTAYSAGHLLYLRGQTLMAHPFDADRGALTGEAYPVVDGIQAYGGTPSGVFAASANGVLVYQPGSVATGSELGWFSRSGQPEDRLGEAGSLTDIRLSRDGARAVISRRGGGDDATADIWIIETATGLANHFTFDSGDELAAVFSPDGRDVVFSSSKNGRFDLYRKAADGSSAEVELLTDEFDKFPTDWSADGKHLLYVRVPPSGAGAGGSRLWVLPLDGGRKPFPLTSEPEAWSESAGTFSADGRFVVYSANDGGFNRVYVSAFPSTGTKWQISIDRGVAPRWSQDGKEIFFIQQGQEERLLMAARVEATGSAVKRMEVTSLFPVSVRVATPGSLYVPSKDGQRFLIITAGSTDRVPTTTPIVVIDWPALRRVSK